MIKLRTRAQFPIRSFRRSGRSPVRYALSGYSLIELMTTLAVAGALAGMAPSLNSLVQDERLATTINGLIADLALTRSEAIRRGTVTTLCKSPDGLQCDTRAKWQEGWIVFADRDGDRYVDDDEEIIRVRQILEPPLSLAFSGFNSNYAVRYQPSGLGDNNGIFTLCDSRGSERARALILNYVGRAYTSRHNASGGELTCPG
jgi:type IV fimbrial biogenesis protein FimT